MEWQDEGILLQIRPQGESSAIVEVLTETQGRHAGVVRGGASRRLAPHLQPGAQLALHWRARLQDQLGAFMVEPLRQRAAAVMGDRLALAGLTAICALAARALPERAPCPAFYRTTRAALDALAAIPDWPVVYVQWELRLLQTIGYGLDLDRCAVTGARDGLAHVSPRTGRAVTAAAAGAWADRLLPMSPVLQGRPAAAPDDMADALRVTGHFLTRGLCPDPDSRPLPEARARLVALLSRT